MDISHITSRSLLHLLSLAEKKDALIKALEEVNTEIARTIRGGAVSVVAALEVVKPAQPKAAAKPAKPAKPAKKREISPEGRARIGTAAKARWAARRASKATVKPSAAKKAPVRAKAKPAAQAKPAKKQGFLQSKFN